MSGFIEDTNRAGPARAYKRTLFQWLHDLFYRETLPLQLSRIVAGLDEVERVFAECQPLGTLPTVLRQRDVLLGIETSNEFRSQRCIEIDIRQTASRARDGGIT